MATVEQFLTSASKEVGYVEIPDNKTKYSKYFGVTVAQWCGYFMMWNAAQVKLQAPNTAYTPNGVAAFKAHKRFFTKGTIPSGAWIYYDFPGDDLDRVSHVGVCVKDFGKYVVSIEGNTAGPIKNKKDERNGGEVVVKIRTKDAIVGWGMPKYEDAPAPIVDKIVLKYAAHLMPKPVKPSKPAAPAKAPAKTPATYTVKSNDTLWDIAKQKGLTVTQLKKLNNLKTDIITVGQKLKLK